MTYAITKPDINPTAIAAAKAALARMLHPYAFWRRAGLDWTADPNYRNIPGTTFVKVGTATIHREDHLDYRIVVALTPAGTPVYALVYGADASYTGGIPVWNPKRVFVDPEGHREVYRAMRYDRVWASSNRGGHSVMDIATRQPAEVHPLLQDPPILAPVW